MIDLTGQRFGRLVVIERVENSKKREARWKCKCDCGNEHIVSGSYLRNGSAKSCGCLNRDALAERRTSHGKTKTRLYQTWRNIINRCENPNVRNFKDYGGRGISICEEWRRDFESFYNWAMANGYDEKLTIDRIDNDGNYDPSNCRWTTYKEQGNNTRGNHPITANGITKNLKEWTEITGIPKSTIQNRLKRGWSPEKALGMIEEE